MKTEVRSFDDGNKMPLAARVVVVTLILVGVGALIYIDPRRGSPEYQEALRQCEKASPRSRVIGKGDFAEAVRLDKDGKPCSQVASEATAVQSGR